MRQNHRLLLDQPNTGIGTGRDVAFSWNGRFDRTVGYVLDDGPWGNHGVVKDPQIMQLGGSVVARFNGSSDYIDLGLPDSLLPTAEISFGAWFRTTTSGTDQAIIGLDSSHKVISLNPWNNDELRTYWNTSGADTYFNPTLPGTYDDGEWHHVMGTYNNSDGDWSIYWDGDFVGSQNFGGDIDIPQVYHITVGAREGGTSWFFDGEIANPFIVRRELT